MTFFMLAQAATPMVEMSLMQLIELLGIAVILGGLIMTVRMNSKNIEKLQDGHKDLLLRIEEQQNLQMHRFEAMEKHMSRAVEKLGEKLTELVDGLKLHLTGHDITLEGHHKDIEDLKGKVRHVGKT